MSFLIRPQNLYKILTILLSLQFSPKIGAETLMRVSCMNCHTQQNAKLDNIFRDSSAYLKAPAKSNQCVFCHANLVSMANSGREIPFTTPFSKQLIAKMGITQSFAQIPSLNGFIKFTNCGLKRFLSQPFSRRFDASFRIQKESNADQNSPHTRHLSSMFALSELSLRQLYKEERLEQSLESCDDLKKQEIISIENSQRGRELYKKFQCATCHQSSSEGPKLRVGFPLLSFKYFQKTLKTGSNNLNRTWVHTQDLSKVKASIENTRLKMPIFSFLSKNEMKGLYSYISTSDEDLQTQASESTSANATTAKIQFGSELFRTVQNQVFRQGCQHCHSSAANAFGDNRSVLLSQTAEAGAFELPDLNQSKPLSQVLAKALQPGPQCQDAKIVQLLEERDREWNGKTKQMPDRGMPLTQRPLSRENIHNLRLWTQQGCPNGFTFLCKACQSQGSHL